MIALGQNLEECAIRETGEDWGLFREDIVLSIKVKDAIGTN